MTKTERIHEPLSEDTRPPPQSGPLPSEPDRFTKGLGRASGGPGLALWGSVVLGAILVLAVVFDF